VSSLFYVWSDRHIRTQEGIKIAAGFPGEVCMRVSKKEYREEILYLLTMVQVRKMLRTGLISEEEYRRMNQKMKDKYHPVSDGLLLER
jgi:hypothetical protein